MGFSLDSLPVIGDIYNTIAGDPRGIKEAYDAQIKASAANAEKMQQFLMGAKGQTQQFYAPTQGMFQSAYGTRGIQGPQTPQGTQGMGSLAGMYGGGR